MNIIREARDRVGMKQKFLAARIGVGQRVLCAWEKERNEPNCRNIVKLARALEVPVQDIVEYYAEHK